MLYTNIFAPTLTTRAFLPRLKGIVSTKLKPVMVDQLSYLLVQKLVIILDPFSQSTLQPKPMEIT